MTTFWHQVLDFATQTTDVVGQQLLSDFGTVTSSEKADGSLVTQSDQWADEEISRRIRAVFPDHGVLSEEVEHIFPEADWCWIIDPIDGTTNFARGIPVWGISLGLLYQGTPIFGYVAFPHLKQAFWGYWAGTSGLDCPGGAFLNGQPIQTSSDEPSGNHFFNLCTRSTDVLKGPDPFPCKIRMVGSATYNLLLVAAGVALGGVEATPKIWDIAAVWAIAQAAGATWIALDNTQIFPLTPSHDYSGRPFPTLVASRDELGDLFQPLVKTVAHR